MGKDPRRTGNLDDKLIRWFDKNKEAFGQKILCAGIGIRPVTHLARIFPDAAIVCLTEDDPAKGGSISVTKGASVKGGGVCPTEDDSVKGDSVCLTENTPGKKGTGLQESLVILGRIENYEGGTFDTVVCCSTRPLSPVSGHSEPEEIPESSVGHTDDRSMDEQHDRFHTGAVYPCGERGMLYLQRASLLMEYYEHAADALCRHLRKGGTLLDLVCSGHDEHLLGYCLALAAGGMEIDPSRLREIHCRENDERLTLQAITAVAGGRTDISSLVAENLNHSLDRMNTAAEELEGHDAELLLQADLAGLVRGYHIYQGEKLMGKIAVYTSLRRDDVLYYFTDVKGDVPYLRRFHTDDRQKLLRHMKGELHRQKASDRNISWRELVLNDDWSESEA